ncbi:MAG: hypothetical protein RR071_10210 [Lachnospiraceae bacterium]
MRENTITVGAVPESCLLSRREGFLFGYFKWSKESGFWFIKVHSLDSIEWITAGTWSDKVISFALCIGVQGIPGICKICGR